MANKWEDRLHNPYHLRSHHRFRAGNTIIIKRMAHKWASSLHTLSCLWGS